MNQETPKVWFGYMSKSRSSDPLLLGRLPRCPGLRPARPSLAIRAAAPVVMMVWRAARTCAAPPRGSVMYVPTVTIRLCLILCDFSADSAAFSRFWSPLRPLPCFLNSGESIPLLGSLVKAFCFENNRDVAVVLRLLRLTSVVQGLTLINRAFLQEYDGRIDSS